MTAREGRVHWYGGRFLPPENAKVRCGLPVLQTSRFGSGMKATHLRELRGGETILVPQFLQEPRRCRRCAQFLRMDTGLLREMAREEVTM